MEEVGKAVRVTWRNGYESRSRAAFFGSFLYGFWGLALRFDVGFGAYVRAQRQLLGFG